MKFKWNPIKDMQNFATDVVDVATDALSTAYRGVETALTKGADLLGLKGLFAIELPPNEGYQVQKQFDTGATLPLVFGQVKVAGNVIDKYISDDYRYLHMIFSISISEQSRLIGVDEIYIDGQSEADANAIWANGVTQGGTRFDGKYIISTNDGFNGWTTPDNWTGGAFTSPLSAGMLSLDPSTMKYNKMLCVYMRVEYSREIWQGEPVPYFIVSPQTIESPAEVIQYYLTNEYGANIDTGQINTTSFSNVSSICNQLVTNPDSTTRKRFTFNGLIDTGKAVQENVKAITAIFDGYLHFTDGQYYLGIKQAGDAVVTITEDDVIDTISQGIGGVESFKNKYEVSFTDADFGYKTNTALYEDTDIRTSRDNGVVLSAQGSVHGVNNYYEALTLAEHLLKQTYYTKSVKVKTSWKIDVSVGEIVGLTLEQFGYADKEFRVQEKSFSMDGTFTYTLVEHFDSMYQTGVQNLKPSAGTATYPNPYLPLPAPTNVVINETIDDVRTGVANIEFTELDSSLVDAYVVKIASTTRPSRIYTFESNQSPIYVDVEPDNYNVTVFARSDLQVNGTESAAISWAVLEDYQYTPPPAVTSLTITETVTTRERFPVSLIELSWSDDAAVTVPLNYEIFQKVGTSYISKGVTSEKSFAFELPSLDYVGQTLEFVVQSISFSQLKLLIANSTSGTVAIVGDTTAPSAPISFDLDVLGETAEAVWSINPLDTDIDYFIMKYNQSIDTASVNWENSLPFIPNISYQTRVKKFASRIGSYLLKAVDTSGNISSDYAIVTTTVPKTEKLNLVHTIDDSQATPAWNGAKTGFIYDSVNNRLESTLNSSTYNFVDTLNLGDIYTVRISSMLDVETTSKTADVRVEVKYASQEIDFLGITDVLSVTDVFAGSDWTPDWKRVNVGDYTGRIFKFRIVSEKTDNDVVYITGDRIDIDMPERIHKENNLSIGAGGMTVNFLDKDRIDPTAVNMPFHQTPSISVTVGNMAQGDYFTVTNQTRSGFDINFYDSTGTGKTGIIDYQAVGYGRVNGVRI